MPDVFFCAAGTLLTSCGWIDALLYTMTRRVFVSNELSTAPHHTHSSRNGNVTAMTVDGTRPGDDFGLHTIDKETQLNARTVTIVGGSNRMSRLVGRGRSHIREKHGHPDPLRENSPTGSQDSIIKPQQRIGIVTETDIQIERARPHSHSESSIGNAR
jgi:hypothetical protein